MSTTPKKNKNKDSKTLNKVMIKSSGFFLLLFLDSLFLLLLFIILIDQMIYLAVYSRGSDHLLLTPGCPHCLGCSFRACICETFCSKPKVLSLHYLQEDYFKQNYKMTSHLKCHPRGRSGTLWLVEQT